MTRDHARVGELAVAALAETDRERLHVRVVPRHERDDGRRIEATGKERAERHVAHHLHLHGLVEMLEEAPDDVAFARTDIARLAMRRDPVAALRELSVLPGGARRGRKLANAVEERLRSRHVAIREEIPHRRKVHIGTRTRQPEERLDLRSEVETVGVLQEEERLLAETVAREGQA